LAIARERGSPERWLIGGCKLKIVVADGGAFWRRRSEGGGVQRCGEERGQGGLLFIGLEWEGRRWPVA
jgi:hypothetical protein